MAELKKSLGYFSILLITVNSVLGTGIFFTPAIAAGIVGVDSILSWGIMAIIALFTSLYFAELTSMFPTSGGIYEFCKQVYGRTMSFFVGWIALIVGYLSVAMLIVGAISYLLPNQNFYILIFSIAIVLVFSYVAYRGIETSGSILMIFGIITLVSLMALIIPGLFFGDAKNLQPLFHTPFPIIILGVFMVAETFFGWETATYLAGETKNGQETVPRAIVHATIIICVLCLLFVVSSIMTLGASQLASSPVPIADLSKILYNDSFSFVFTIIVYLSIIGSVAGGIISVPRLMQALSQDRLFIKQLAFINPTYQTPSKAIAFQAIIVCLFVVIAANTTNAYETLLKLLIPLLFFLYSMVLGSVILLRIRQPERERPFKAPFAKIIPFLLILIFLSMIVYWAIQEAQAMQLLILVTSFIAIGIPLYFLVELYNNAKFSQQAKDNTAQMTLLLENININAQIQQELISYLGHIEGKTVLEYGSSVGTLTKHLLKHVGPTGHIICINNSHAELKILQNRFRHHSQLELIHHEQYHEKVHPFIKVADAMISLDTLNAIDNVSALLKQLKLKLKPNARVCFFDNIDYFNILPNQHWLTDTNQIKDLFSKEGFQVRVKRIKGIFWNYIVIYGILSDEHFSMV